METSQMTKKFLDFQRDALSSWYDAVASMQKQAASSVNLVLDQSDWLPVEGRQMMQNWVKACQKGCDDYKDLVEDSINELEKVLVIKSKKKSAPKKSVAKKKTAITAKRKAHVAVAKTTGPAAKPVSVTQDTSIPSAGEAGKTTIKP